MPHAQPSLAYLLLAGAFLAFLSGLYILVCEQKE
jgi:hypothetical protein